MNQPLLKIFRAVFVKLWSAAICQVVRHGPQAGSFGRKNITKIMSDTEQIKTYTNACLYFLPLLVGLQLKVG
jgi:hypothetical protein